MNLLLFEPAATMPSWLVAILFGVPFIGGILFYSYKTRHARSWRKGIFPIKLKPTEDNFLEAYLALGAKLIILNYTDSKGKTTFINQYFNRFFKFANYNFGDSLIFSLNYPIQPKTITDWMKMHLPDEGARSQVIYFLTGLALVTGQINQRELSLIKQINADLGLPTENVHQIIAIYTSYYESKKRSSTFTTKESNLENAYTILGLKNHSSQQEIKKAYRELVKKHHPDCFKNGSEFQLKIATEKFIEIQHAYELLSKK